MDGGGALPIRAGDDRAPDANDPAVSRPRRFRPQYQPLVVVLIAAAVGIIIDRYGRPQSLAAGVEALGGSAWFLVWYAVASLCLALWWTAWRREPGHASACVLLAAVAAIGGAWHHLNWFDFQSDELARFAHLAPEPACIEAVACESAERVSAPQETPLRAIPATERSRLLLAVTRIRAGRGWQAASGTCQLSVNGHLLWVRPGDRLRIFGQLARPAPPLNPGEFDFAANARANRQLTRIRSSAPECVVRLATGSEWAWQRWLDVARSRAKYLVRSMVGPARAGLAQAILLGAREGLPFEETEPYLETGTVHVLVVSGMNVAILAAGLLGLMQLGWLPRRVGLAVIVVVVIAYALLAEAQPPVMRAAVLGVLACVAIWTGRKGMAFNSLCGAALLIVAINPSDLFRAGPQLSFLAVAALVWAGRAWWKRPVIDDPLEELIDSVRPWPLRILRWIMDWSVALLVTSAAVWAVTLPLVLYTFHIVSPIAIPASLLVWPLVTVAMWSGFVMVVAGWLVPAVGTVSGAICGWSLAGLEWLVRWAESLPLGHFWAPGPAWWWVAGFYVGVIVAMVWGRALLAVRWQFAALSVWLLVGLLPAIVRNSTRDGLDVSFVAVGHGECVVLQTPNGKTLLYDAGAIGSPEYATQTIASYLWHLGIMRIDGIVISHADSDHYNAVPGLLERFHVGAVYVSPVMFSGIGEANTTGGVEVLRTAIKQADVPLHEIWAGNQLNVAADVAIRVLHPPRRGLVGSDNANSLTLAIESAGRRLLLPGDLESPGLDDLLAEAPYNCDILLAPHHGSRRSDPPGFATWSTPEWVVISGGGEDDIRTVAVTYERSGARVLSTNDDGTVKFTLRADSSLLPAVWRGRVIGGIHQLPKIR